MQRPYRVMFFKDIRKSCLPSIDLGKTHSEITFDFFLECYEKPGLWELNASIVGHLKSTRFLCFYFPAPPKLLNHPYLQEVTRNQQIRLDS